MLLKHKLKAARLLPSPVSHFVPHSLLFYVSDISMGPTLNFIIQNLKFNNQLMIPAKYKLGSGLYRPCFIYINDVFQLS